jgi:hypothetical protein
MPCIGTPKGSCGWNQSDRDAACVDGIVWQILLTTLSRCRWRFRGTRRSASSSAAEVPRCGRRTFAWRFAVSGDFSRGMGLPLWSRHALDKRCLKSSRHDLESSYAAKHRTSERSACIVAGRDPRSREGDLARKQPGKMGSRPAMKRFLPRTGLVRVPSRVPWSGSA